MVPSLSRTELQSEHLTAIGTYYLLLDLHGSTTRRQIGAAL